MKKFYDQVRVDEKGHYFFAVCPVCGKRQYGNRVSIFCRNMNTSDHKKKIPIVTLRQYIFNKNYVSAVQELAVYFNLCRSCGEWVCDECFVSGESDDICKKCKEKK